MNLVNFFKMIVIIFLTSVLASCAVQKPIPVTKQADYIDLNFEQIKINDITVLPILDYRNSKNISFNDNDYSNMQEKLRQYISEKGYSVNIKNYINGTTTISKINFEKIITGLDKEFIKKIGDDDDRYFFIPVLTHIKKLLEF